MNKNILVTLAALSVIAALGIPAAIKAYNALMAKIRADAIDEATGEIADALHSVSAGAQGGRRTVEATADDIIPMP